MGRACRHAALAALLLPALAGAPSYAALDEAALLARLQDLAQRVQQLEQRNRVLEQALASERLSEREPELATRLKAVESQVLSSQPATRHIEALDGISVSAALTSMVQRTAARGSADGRAHTRANYRGDVSVELPGGATAGAEGRFFAHLRFGQGQGVALRPSFTSTANTTAFEVAGVGDPDSSFAVLAQAGYQLTLPLPLGGVAAQSRQRVELTVGKLDPFVFFDQNTIADDESTRFVNNVFVHNPLLDSGGDTGADAYGFAPGVRVAYRDEREAGAAWGASLGVFGAGAAADFSGSLARPFVIGQLDATWRPWRGLDGTYRAYAWHNGQATDVDGRVRAHRGWGLSADQRISDDVRLFGRIGQRTAGRGRFDRALTFGAEIAGDGWRRGADALGVALAWLPAGRGLRAATQDASFAGYAAFGAERIMELYYRVRVNDHVELTPDLQWIGRAAADPAARGFASIGLRAKFGF